jgi:hypothetical protein
MILETGPFTQEQRFLIFGATASPEWFNVRSISFRQRYELAQYETGATKRLGLGTFRILDIITSPTVTDLTYQLDRTGKILEGHVVLSGRLEDEIQRVQST